MLEKAIEQKVVKAATQLGVQVRKLNGEGQRGWPDRLFCIPGGRPLFVEFKRPGGELSKLQVFVIERLRKDGYHVEVVDQVEKGIQLLRDAMDAAQVSRGGNKAPARASRRGPVS